MEYSTVAREKVVTILPGQALPDSDRSLAVPGGAKRTNLCFDDTYPHAIASRHFGGPEQFHRETLLWSLSNADVVLIDGGLLGPDSDGAFRGMLRLAKFVVHIRTFPQRVDVWSRSIRPYVEIDSPIFHAVMPAHIVPIAPEVEAFKDFFHISFREVGDRQ